MPMLGEDNESNIQLTEFNGVFSLSKQSGDLCVPFRVKDGLWLLRKGRRTPERNVNPKYI